MHVGEGAIPMLSCSINVQFQKLPKVIITTHARLQSRLKL
jgi:hypothetical protein